MLGAALQKDRLKLPTWGRSSSKSSRQRAGRGPKEVGMIGQASFASSVVNLLNTIVGAGVLAMPLALSRMGITLGIFTIMWAGITAGFGLYLQTRCARYLDRGSASFFALSQITYPSAAVIFDAAIAIKCFGVGISYLIIIGDLMPGVVQGLSANAGEVGFLVDRHFWVTGFMLIVIPLSFLRRLDSLKYTSFIALVSIGYLVLLVVAHFVRGDTLQEKGDVRVIKWQSGVATLSSFPVIVFAYTCHQNMFSILNEIANNSHFRTTGVVFASIGTAAFIYILVAVTGYLSFGNNVGANIVAQYSPSVSATIGKAAIVILVMFSYPLQVHPCRASVDAVLKWRPGKRPSPHSHHHHNRSDFSSPTPSTSSLVSNTSPGRFSRPPPGGSSDGMSETRFAIITTAIIILSYFVAMTVSSLERVLAYVGSTGSTSISFILPGLFYHKISSPDSALHQKLMKEDDDGEAAAGGGSSGGIADSDGADASGGGVGGAEDEGLLGGGGGGGGGSNSLRRGRGGGGGESGWDFLTSPRWQRGMLRRLSLALAIYGVIVMVVCLVTNTVFSVVAH